MDYGNPFSKFVLFLWVPITLALFARMRAPRAAAYSLIGAVLFLPELVNFDMPAIPAFGKQSIAALWSLIGCMIWSRSSLRWSRATSGVSLLMLVFLAGVVITSLQNGDVLRYGPARIAATSLYDGISDLLLNVLNYFIPFFLARNLYRTRTDLVMLFRCLLWLGGVYCLLALVEVRLSPQLHHWIYGFMQHEFYQTVRGTGFRPMIFMAHGLAVALFILATTMTAYIFGRIGGRLAGVGGRAIGVVMTVVLVLCKSTGALLYALFCIPLLLVSKARTIARVAFILGVVVIAYPAVRFAGWLPIDDVVNSFRTFSDERAESLYTRLSHEEILIHKAHERLWFGWGGYGRNRYFNEEGRDVSITDSHWAICFGTYGLVGYLAFFGMLVIPLWMAFRQNRKIRDRRSAYAIAGLALISAVHSFDLLLNGLFSFLPVFFAGALLGAVEGADAELHPRTRRSTKRSMHPMAPPPASVPAAPETA